MTLPWNGEMFDVVGRAQAEAGHANAQLTTAFLLKALSAAPGEAGVFLRAQGVDSATVLGLPAAYQVEPAGAVENIYERARRLAASARQDTVTPLHLLHALADERRTNAKAMLHESGANMQALRTMAFSMATTPYVRQAPAHQAAAGVWGRTATTTLPSQPNRVPRQIGLHPALAGHTTTTQEPPAARLVESSGAFPVVEGDCVTEEQIVDEDMFLSMEETTASMRTVSPAAPRPGVTPTQQDIFFPDPVGDELPNSDPSAGGPPEARHGQRTKTQLSAPQSSSQPFSRPPRRPARGSSKPRRRTARESQVDTARDLAQRLFPAAEKSAPPARGGVRKGRAPNGVRSRRRVGANRKAIAGFDRFALNPKAFPMLVKFGRNLLEEARAGRLDPVIGRDEEMDHLIDVLNKRRSNNPVLVGAAGVGKTAIAEGLARIMAQDEPPPGLGDRTVIGLDVGTILRGTQLRGSFQERLNGIKDEVRKAEGRIILFLDELHTWLGAGGGDAGSDAAGELKVALARGELPCIGATTHHEFKRVIEADPAFERRFEVVEVKPPSIEDTVRIVGGVIDRYAAHHQVQYGPESIESAVRLSDRYIRERMLPDKALGLLDRAGSVARRAGSDKVEREHIARVVSNRSGVAIERLLMTDAERLLTMEEHLARNLVGHSQVISRIARVVRRNHAGFGSHRPIGSFLFLGPTGVGKTEMVKVLADFLFGSRDAIVRFDMSEFMEQHAVARLLGAPPGYVGFEDGGQLTEALRRHPYQIVLLDEVEKAHPDVLHILLQLLDEGRVTDGKGRTVDFSNAVVIMTSNLGGEAANGTGRSSIGFAAQESLSTRRSKVESRVVDIARKAFPPELWNRIEERAVFHPLEREDVAAIAELQLQDSAERLLTERKITLRFRPELIEHLIEHGGFDPAYGARPMRKTIQRLVEAPIADAILRGEVREGDDALVGVLDGRVEVVEPACGKARETVLSGPMMAAAFAATTGGTDLSGLPS